VRCRFFDIIALQPIPKVFARFFVILFIRNRVCRVIEMQQSNCSLSSRIRQMILRCAKRANVGHIGSALSTVEILAALYWHVLRIPAPEDPQRDRFILSKGHAALALYVTLFLKKWITEKELVTYCMDDSLLGVHPDHLLRGVDFSTGSLGHGLSLGAGAALAARLSNSSRRVCVLVSDAECNAGSLWESVMFAAHHRLSNLIAVIDLNGQQALDYTERVLDLSPLSQRWRAFGWDVHEVDGHDIESISTTANELATISGPPHAIIARTIFGKGVSYMENQIKWHYWPMSDEDYRQALEETRKTLGSDR
jgi:transketolase